jgi:Uma2 family endonuclease
MANYHSTVTADKGLKATHEEYNALKVALEASGDDQSGAVELEYHDGEIYVFASEYADWEALSRNFRALLGALVAKNGLNYLEFDTASTCGGSEMGTHGGVRFRVRPNGSLWEPN